MSLYLQQVNKHVQETEAAVLVAQPGKIEPFDEDTFPNCQQEKHLHEAVMQAIQLCQRNSQTIQEKESEELWFRVLDAISLPLNKYKNAGPEQPEKAGPQQPHMQNRMGPRRFVVKGERLKRGYTLLVQMILQNMMGHLPLAAIVQKMVADNGKENFGGFRNIFMSMLDVTSYERNILQTANKLLESDVYAQTAELYKCRAQPFAIEKVNVSSPSPQPPPQKSIQPGQEPNSSTEPAPAERSDSRKTIQYIEPQSESKLGLLNQLLSSSSLVPPADFGGHPDLVKISKLDARPIGRPQSGRMNVAAKPCGLVMEQAFSLYGSTKN